MDFIFVKVYVKFYLIQLHNSLPYFKKLKKEYELNQFLDENNDLFTNVEPKNNETLPISKATEKIEKALTLVEIESDTSLKKMFVFKNKIFSKIEVMGLVIDYHFIGSEEKENSRAILYLDDSTGIINCLSWKNKSSANYQKISQLVNSIIIF